MKNKKLLISLLAIFLVFSGAGIGVGNYFVDYGIARPENSDDDPLSPPSIESEAELKNVEINNINIAQMKIDLPPIEKKLISFDGLNLWANIYQQESNNWVILVHGYQSSHESVEDLAYEYYIRGYNIITPDLRAHGNSEGEYITMGLHDATDIIMWSDYIIGLNPNANIILHGESMGAATVMIAAGHKDLPSNVIAIIEDCGYTDGYQMMLEQLEYRFNLPSFPIMNFANLMSSIRAGYDMKDANPLKSLETASVPILFMHGLQDIFVKPYMHTILYDSYSGPKDSIIFKDADHTAANKLLPEVYYPKVFSFIEEFTGLHTPVIK